eukprot:5133410-Ditylum_brightwellii.AAC.1
MAAADLLEWVPTLLAVKPSVVGEADDNMEGDGDGVGEVELVVCVWAFSEVSEKSDFLECYCLGVLVCCAS